MVYPTIPLAQSIIELCKAKKLTNVVISPGSRNAPLTIGFTNDPFFTCYSIADERCAAFFGMGLAQQTHIPTILVCTSGSALLNYYPAVAEAFYSQIPLIVLSADRPLHKIDIGDGQTIRQQNVYQNHILYSANLTEDANSTNDQLINTAINTAITAQGPVHINAPFEEPLYQTTEQRSVNPIVEEPQFPALPAVDYDYYAKQWNKATKKLILVGSLAPHTVTDDVIAKLTADGSTLFLAETISNIQAPSVINAIDRLVIPMDDEALQNLQPDILLTFGGMVVSKKIKQFLRQYAPKQHWHVDTLRHYDTYDCLTDRIYTDAQSFLTQLTANTQPISSTYSNWANAIMVTRNTQHKQHLHDAIFSDFTALDSIVSQLPKNSQIQVSNSAVIRYVQLLPVDSSIEVFCNRGTSGIDGCTSTAIGAAIGSGKSTVLLTGDISFFYDSNALWNAYVPKDFKIVLINNGGGGIFRTLPGHQENEVFNTYFETTHQHTAQHLAAMYDWAYFQADTTEALSTQAQAFFNTSDRPAILEVNTPTFLNDEVFKKYYRNM
ncbi:2-succinyl-5-enolpyruvyl-6-hydroxy-3-cyclohexene-1-carboxylic-acid synthase [Myroides odoratus]|uniref:2-succinyl-5-enolpyruvyl-6-hydroxy-3-cyclohexene-1-carboxylate synthase n=1 Tax=Myroides odoratus TaxID=256 RepID=A0A9Q6Z9S5_MYROD|nr:2-succinyl-5-enolpyruvyl-6-hydroxy-3-cyclohexene-1-carboxylic-acid synthase [Myroides odoratus]EHQ43668.1 2-succinyl-6-hydroxy-2,4-cyclohexadiene-1-carboxylate synthase [Myroides odoratus DSM 2801]EKB04337.1 2-succinyl-5-enolpyruvyl-6-hydroxy-3-cyclohexene-1-carboxylic-acid synthase [Myroides odoratus CIP 103059]QQU00988.1 2-succinyl-5-enolpyruvyl-6-hydroxy-3-cyclohexene-1-carboxylic-acid synthase [Myroides odoratus]WQD56762.1 2-succinyl-5-enolpyruvyl-6-hydroxy-3-cyclohexene-1-carboxylic-aci